MLPFALNHMTVPNLRHDALFALAARLGCIGVELRNDLGRPLFEGDRPEDVAAQARAQGIRIIGLSQVYPFNAWSDAIAAKVADLIETIEVLEQLNVVPHFKLVHDTFHHHLAGGGPFFPDYTGLIHISGVTDKTLAVNAMEDEHRVLVDRDDVLGNVAQIAALRDAGYRGAISFEAFSPLTHQRSDIEAALAESMRYIRTEIDA